MKKSKIILATFALSLGLITQSCGDKTESNDNSNDNKEVSNSQQEVVYKTVKIGEQEWMLENLNIDKFNNGDLIPQASTDAEWKAAIDNKTPAWCYQNNDEANGSKYGKLYNWYAVTDPRGFAPKGWHVPTLKEFDSLRINVGGFNTAGDQLKSQLGWMVKDGISNTNESGFTALPGGTRLDNAKFKGETEYGVFWSSDLSSTERAYAMGLSAHATNAVSFNYALGEGCSVRCIKD